MYRWSKLQFVCNPAGLNEIIIYRIPSLKYALQFRSWGIKLFEIQKMLPWTQFGLKTAFTIDYYWNKIILCFTFLRFFPLRFWKQHKLASSGRNFDSKKVGIAWFWQKPEDWKMPEYYFLAPIYYYLLHFISFNCGLLYKLIYLFLQFSDKPKMLIVHKEWCKACKGTIN
jgi:hypothetical protein